MIAQSPASASVTTLRFPLERGRYRIRSVGKLTKRCNFPVVLAIRLAVPDGMIDIVRHRFRPGEVKVLDEVFEVDEAGREVVFTTHMGEEAKNNWGAQLYLTNLAVEILSRP